MIQDHILALKWKNALSDPYCGCDLDPKFGMPVGWDPSEIWLDIAIILDTSEAMGEVAMIDVSPIFIIGRTIMGTSSIFGHMF